MNERGKPTVLCVGRLYADLIFTGVPRLPSLGTEVFADGVDLHAGGGAFITAAHLASLGHRSCLAATLPPPPFGALIADDLDASGVSRQLCREGRMSDGPQLTVAVVTGGDRAFLTRRAGPPFPDLTAGDIRASGASHIHIGELGTLVERPQILDLAKAAGATVSLDCGWDDALRLEDVAGLAGRVDVFLPNEAEAAHLERLGLTEPLAPLTVIKRGADGAVAISGRERLAAPPCPAEVVDTTGAGDAFNAGFLSAWLSGADIADCLASGNRQGAMAITQPGGFRRQKRGVPEQAAS